MAQIKTKQELKQFIDKAREEQDQSITIKLISEELYKLHTKVLELEEKLNSNNNYDEDTDSFNWEYDHQS